MKKKVAFSIFGAALLWFAVMAMIPAEGSDAAKAMNAEFQKFLQVYEAKVIPLSRQAALASFQANISGKDEDFNEYSRLQIELRKIHADAATFQKLKGWQASGWICDPLLQRQLTVLYNAFLGNQVSPADLEELVRQQTAIEQKFNTFRARVNNQTLSDNDVEEILRSSTDSAALEAAWKASKEIGPRVGPDIIKLAHLRNRVARSLGFADYHQMQLKLNEQDPEAIEKLFDDLDTLTRDAFRDLKGDIDSFLAKREGINPTELRPWHFQNRFFQEAPKIYTVDLDIYYANKDLVALTRSYYSGIGLDIDDLVARSDLFEKPGKYQHAFSSDIDREGDVRVLCSIKPNQAWMDTLLHEYGHSVYAKFNDRSLPWTLRDAAHAFTTEAVANMFGRLAASPLWLHDMVGISTEEMQKIAGPSRDSLRLEQMVFSRWAQVMYRFEKSFYADPDQDLNARWWELVEKYQLVRKPEGRNEPDWASKIHIASYPAYYHNYLLGQLLASQLHYYIASKVLNAAEPFAQSFVGKKEVGEYLIRAIFHPGMRYEWNEMIERATGEKLTPKYYARQFLGEIGQ